LQTAKSGSKSQNNADSIAGQRGIVKLSTEIVKNPECTDRPEKHDYGNRHFQSIGSRGIPAKILS
jgi:hypothetical protein